MTEKLKPVRPPRTAAEKKAWGEMQPVRYPDTLGKKVGGWLAGWLMPWKR
jgi:hypothetical protein